MLANHVGSGNVIRADIPYLVIIIISEQVGGDYCVLSPGLKVIIRKNKKLSFFSFIDRTFSFS